MQKESTAYLVQSKWTRTRAAALNTAQRLQQSHVTWVTWSMHVTTQQGDSPHSTTHPLAAATSSPKLHLIKLIIFLPICSKPQTTHVTTTPTRQMIHQLHLTPTHSPLLTKAWHSHPCKIWNRLKHCTLSGCIISFISIHFRYANLHYPSYLRITHWVGVLKALLYHYYSLRLTLTFLICAPSTLT